MRVMRGWGVLGFEGAGVWVRGCGEASVSDYWQGLLGSSLFLAENPPPLCWCWVF